MKIEAYRIWIVLFVAIFAVSGYMYFTILDNQDQLIQQSYRSLELTKNNIEESWENYSVRETGEISQQVNQGCGLLQPSVWRSLLQQMPPSRFFDFIIIADTSGTVTYTEPQLPVPRMNPAVLADSDSLGATQLPVTISAEPYQVFQTQFSLPVTIESTTLRCPVYLFGGVSQDSFDRAGRKVSFSTLYLLFTLLSLLIITFPILRIAGMGRGDTVLQSHIYQIGLSIILLSIFTGYSISYLTSRAEIREDQNDTIEKLTENLSSLFNQQINNFAELLEDYFREDELNQDTIPDYNEIIEIGEDGRISRINLQPNGGELPSEALTTLPSLENRYYFKQANLDHFLLGSHFSYLENGDQEGVISRKYRLAPDQQDVDSLEVVRAVTFSLKPFNRQDSLHINPTGLKYLVSNPSGDVFYQSSSIRTNIPNIRTAINPDQWNQIQLLMTNNPELEGSLEMPVSFEGQNYIAHLNRLDLTPFESLRPVWLITLRDQNLRYFRSFAIFLYSSTGIAILVLCFLFISFFFVLFAKRSHYLQIKQFSFAWFRPGNSKRKRYQLFLFILGIHFLYFFYILSGDYHNFWFIVFSFCEAISYIALQRYILLSDVLSQRLHKQNRLIPFALGSLTILFLIIAQQFGSLSGGKVTEVLILFLIQSALFAITMVFNKSGRLTPDIKHENIHQNRVEITYALAFTLWVMVIGFLPGYTIHHSAFHYENNLWQQASASPHAHADQYSQSETAHNQKNGAFGQEVVNQMEYQRRQWLNNLSGIQYPVIDRYIYTDRKNVEASFAGNHFQDHRKSAADIAWLLMFILIAGGVIYLLILILTRRVFLTRYWDFRHKHGTQTAIGSKTILICLDKWVGVRFVKERLPEQLNCRVLDLAATSLPAPEDVEKTSEHGFIVLNPANCIHTASDLQKFTAFLFQCHQLQKVVVLVTSQSLKQLTEHPDRDSDPVIDALIKNWVDAMAEYGTLILPVSNEAQTHRDDTDIHSTSWWYDLIEDIQYSPNEPALRQFIKPEFEQIIDQNLSLQAYDSVLLVIQRFNKAYYMNTWEKLTFREKKMVHNFAKEGFINFRNVDVLTELLQKGIFRMDPYRERISLFNQSFTNFAASAPSDRLIEEFKNDRRKNGNSVQLRNAVLTFILLAILGFSIIAPELLDRYIGAISGGLAVISTLASLINKYTLKLPFIGKSGGESIAA